MIKLSKWTNEELEYLELNYGTKPVKKIAEHLNRSIRAVTERALIEGYGAFTENGDYITFFQLIKAFGLKNSYRNYYKWWVVQNELPVMRKTVINSKVVVVKLKEFWKWAEQHKDLVNFSKLEENLLGAEPAWVKAKRRDDYINYKPRFNRWTDFDIAKLKLMISQGKTYADVAEVIDRSYESVKKKCYELGIEYQATRARR